MKLPLMTNELAERLERADLEVMQGRLEAVQKRVGNPYGVEIRAFGGATALMAKGIPIVDFNKVFGFGPEDVGRLDDIVEWYEGQQMAFGFDVSPAKFSTEMAAALRARGFCQSGFHTALYGAPNAENLQLSIDVTVHEV
ncbi:MAG: hypothetical protein ACXVPC_12150, partial [Tumebacillaceae bacterium]